MNTMAMSHRVTGIVFTVLLSFLLAFSTYAVPLGSQLFIEDGTITIDNDFSDWPEEGLVIDESAESDIDHDYYCYDMEEADWSLIEGEDLGREDATEQCEGGFVYSDTGQIDLRTVYFGVNNENMYLGFDAAWPMMGAWDVDEERFIDVWEFVPEYEIPSLPFAFDHNMVFAFGPADEEVYNYYVVAEIFLPEDLTTVFTEEGPVEDFQDVTLKVYAESGDTLGWDELDEVLGTIETDQGDEEEGEEEFEECESEEACEEEANDRNLSTAFEVEQNIEAFYELTGMTPDSYGFRMETHSDVGDVTDRVVVSTQAALDAPENLRVEKQKPKRVMLRWDAVESADRYRVQVHTKKGKVVKTFKNVPTNKRVFGKKLAKANRAYKYRVRSCSSSTVDSCGDWSEYKNFRTIPAKPANVTATVTDGSAELTWDAPAGATINWYFAKIVDSNGELVVKGKVEDGTSLTVTGLDAGEYTLKLRSVHGKKNRSSFATSTFTVTE